VATITALLDWMWWQPSEHHAPDARINAPAAARYFDLSAHTVSCTVERLVTIGVLDNHTPGLVAPAMRGAPCARRLSLPAAHILAVIEAHAAPAQRAALLATLRALVVVGKPTATDACAVDVKWNALVEERGISRRAISPYLQALESASLIARDATQPPPPRPMRYRFVEPQATAINEHPAAVRTVEVLKPNASTDTRMIVHPDGRFEMIAAEWTPTQWAEFARAHTARATD